MFEIKLSPLKINSGNLKKSNKFFKKMDVICCNFFLNCVTFLCGPSYPKIFVGFFELENIFWEKRSKK